MVVLREEMTQGVRWQILKQLAKEPLTASVLAKRAKTSLPAVSQATKLLSAQGVLRVEQYPGPGKPRAMFSLREDVALITLCGQGVAKKISINPSALDTATIRAFSLPVQDKDWVIQLLWSYRDLLSTVDAIAYVRSEKEETHIMVLTSNIDEYRKKYSHITLEAGSSRRKIISWSHTMHEAQEGLVRKEEYFVDLFRKPSVLFDPKNNISHIQEEFLRK